MSGASPADATRNTCPAARVGMAFPNRRFFMRRLTALCAAFRHCAVCHQNRQPAKAAFHVIKWSGNDLCQVWNDSVATKPWPSDYKVVSRPHKTLDGALAVKAGLIKRGVCKI
jgi:hypothetical protein